MCSFVGAGQGTRVKTAMFVFRSREVFGLQLFTLSLAFVGAITWQKGLSASEGDHPHITAGFFRAKPNRKDASLIGGTSFPLAFVVTLF